MVYRKQSMQYWHALKQSIKYWYAENRVCGYEKLIFGVVYIPADKIAIPWSSLVEGGEGSYLPKW